MSCLSKKGNRGSAAARILGIGLMVIGAILLLVAVPRWVWSTAVAIFLIGLGYIIWRFLG